MEILNYCPVCKGNKFNQFMNCVDYTVSRETFNIVQCEKCGFKFTNPRPDENDISRYYESDEYISHSGTNRGLVNKIYGLVRNYTIRKKVQLVDRLNKNTSSVQRNILDIGCGTGEFLSACKKGGWNITGIEPSDMARKLAKEKNGLELLSPRDLFELKGKQFSVITLWHVLEHIYQLDKTIDQIKKLLNDDGILIIAVPNCSSFDQENYGIYWAAWDLPRHIYHFTEKNIKELLGRTGFDLTEVLPMKFDSYYVSLLSEKYKTGRANLWAGFQNGLRSNISARKERRGYSSQIYIFKNAK